MNPSQRVQMYFTSPEEKGSRYCKNSHNSSYKSEMNFNYFPGIILLWQNKHFNFQIHSNYNIFCTERVTYIHMDKCYTIIVQNSVLFVFWLGIISSHFLCALRTEPSWVFLQMRKQKQLYHFYFISAYLIKEKQESLKLIARAELVLGKLMRSFYEL